MHEERTISQDLDGARILWRKWYGDPLAPFEGWVREFSAGGRHVRLSATLNSTDAGTWHESTDVRVISVLEAAKSPSAVAQWQAEAGE